MSALDPGYEFHNDGADLLILPPGQPEHRVPLVQCRALALAILQESRTSDAEAAQPVEPWRDGAERVMERIAAHP